MRPTHSVLMAMTALSPFAQAQCPLPGSLFGPIQSYSRDEDGLLEGSVIIDLNGDTIPDLITAGGNGPIFFNAGLGDGAFGPSEILNGLPGGNRGIAAGDVNGDGVTDFALGKSSGLALMLNDGVGNLSSTTLPYDPGFSAPVAVALVDLDGDTDLDFLVISQSNSSLWIGFNDGAGGLASSSVLPTHGALSVPVGDLNNDSIPDLAVPRYDPGLGPVFAEGLVQIFLGNGDGTFADQGSIVLETNLRNVAIADFDGDLSNDLVVSFNVGSIQILFGDGDGGFAPPVSIDTGSVFLNGSRHGLLPTDVDLDGDTDLVFNGAFTVSTFINPGDGTLFLGQDLGSPEFLPQLGGVGAVGDLDGDLTPDIIMQAPIERETYVFLNQCPPVTLYTATMLGEIQGIDPSIPAAVSTVVGDDIIEDSNELEFMDGKLYLSEGPAGASPGRLHRVNLASGAVEASFDLMYPTNVMGFDPDVLPAMEAVGGRLFAAAAESGGSSGAFFVEIVLVGNGRGGTNGVVNLIGSLGISSPVTGLAWNGQKLYALSGGGSSPRLYEVNTITGQASFVSDIVIDGNSGIGLTGLEFDADGTLYGIVNNSEASSGNLIRIDPETGIATDLGVPGSDRAYGITSTEDDPPNLLGVDIVSSSTSLTVLDQNDPSASERLTDAMGQLSSPAREVEVMGDAVFAILTNDLNLLYEIDPETGDTTAHPVEGIGPDDEYRVITALEAVGGVLYSALAIPGSGNTSDAGIAILEPDTSGPTDIYRVRLVGRTGVAAPLTTLTWNGQTLYGITGGGTDAEVFTIDPRSGAAQPLGAVMLGGFPVQISGGEIDVNGNFYAVTSDDFDPESSKRLLRIDLEPLSTERLIGDTILLATDLGIIDSDSIDAISAFTSFPGLSSMITYDNGERAMYELEPNSRALTLLSDSLGISQVQAIEYDRGIVYLTQGGTSDEQSLFIYDIASDSLSVLEILFREDSNPFFAMPSLESIGGVLYTAVYDDDEGETVLAAINTESGQVSPIGSDTIGDPMIGLMWTGTELLAVTGGGSCAELYEIDITTGEFSYIDDIVSNESCLELSAAAYDADGFIYALDNGNNEDIGFLFRVDPSDGDAILLGPVVDPENPAEDPRDVRSLTSYNQPQPGTPNLIVDPDGTRDQDVFVWGDAGGLTGISFGAEIRNIGSGPVAWDANSPDHPVLLQNDYIATEYGLFHTSQAYAHHPAGLFTPGPSRGATSLIPGSTETALSFFAGFQPDLGPRADINPITGEFAYPFTQMGEFGDAIFKRATLGIEPVGEPLLLIRELQVISADEIARGGPQGDNITVVITRLSVDRTDVGAPRGEETGDAATRVFSGELDETLNTRFTTRSPGSDPDLDLDGIVTATSSVVDLGGGTWRYSYTIHNQTSHRAIGSVFIPTPGAATATPIDGMDPFFPPRHSGEEATHSNAEWTITGGSEADDFVVFSVPSQAEDPAANRIGFGTAYTFVFESNAPPVDGQVIVGSWISSDLGGSGQDDDYSLSLDVPSADIGPMPCSPADLAEEFGVLNFNDVIEFLTLFAAMDPAANFDAKNPAINFNDVIAFLTIFADGCPSEPMP